MKSGIMDKSIKKYGEQELRNQINLFVNSSIKKLRYKETILDQVKIKDAVNNFKTQHIKSIDDIAFEILCNIEYCRLDKTANPIKKAEYYLKTAFINELLYFNKKHIKIAATNACELIIDRLKEEKNINARNNLSLFAKSIIKKFGLPKYLIETLKDEETYSVKNLIRHEGSSCSMP